MSSMGRALGLCYSAIQEARAGAPAFPFMLPCVWAALRGFHAPCAQGLSMYPVGSCTRACLLLFPAQTIVVAGPEHIPSSFKCSSTCLQSGFVTTACQLRSAPGLGLLRLGSVGAGRWSSTPLEWCVVPLQVCLVRGHAHVLQGAACPTATATHRRPGSQPCHASPASPSLWLQMSLAPALIAIAPHTPRLVACWRPPARASRAP